MKNVIEQLLRKGVLISPDMAEEELDIDALLEKKDLPVVVDRTSLREPETTPKEEEEAEQPAYAAVEVLQNFHDMNEKISVQDFVNLYTTRFEALRNLLQQRQELQGATSIRKLRSRDEREHVTCIALILDISKTRNDNYMLTLEDKTGTMRAIVTKRNKTAYELAKDLTPDEVIGIQGSKGNNIVFINTIVLPEIPLNKEYKKSPHEEAALFIGDVHVGSTAFIEKDFDKFISWLAGDVGSPEQKKLLDRIKYLFIVGDLVEGIGIYPGQEKELTIQDIYEQYRVFTEYIKRIPKHINIIICPGNHDSIRVAEPQPPLPKELVPQLYEMDNVYMVSSPSTVRIGQSERFSGFDVILYHGYSFPYYANNVESLRFSGGLEKTENIIRWLMKKRHFAPTHGSTQYQLGYPKDPLVITDIPDFVVTGHIHRASVLNYKNVTLLNCSCWIAQTPYQEKRGLVPQPSRAIYVDLKTRQTKMLNFT